MSIICSSDRGWILDHEKSINVTYMNQSCILNIEEKQEAEHSALHACLRCPPEMFQVHRPYMMDSQFSKLANQQSSAEGEYKSNKVNVTFYLIHESFSSL